MAPFRRVPADMMASEIEKLIYLGAVMVINGRRGKPEIWLELESKESANYYKENHDANIKV